MPLLWRSHDRHQVFARGREPRWRPTPVRIDTS
jgi:hypothetical protein